MRKYLWIALAALAVVSSPVMTRADQIDVFDASGTFGDGSTLSGTLTIDVTSGVATAADLTVSTPDSLTFTFIQAHEAFSTTYEIQTGTTASGLPNLDILLPTNTLVGYAGGSINPGSDIFYSSTTHVDLLSGALTPVPEIDPQNAMPPFALIAGVVLIIRGRRRK